MILPRRTPSCGTPCTATSAGSVTNPRERTAAAVLGLLDADARRRWDRRS
ncbi:hypothetical protein [Cellulomonas sp.]